MNKKLVITNQVSATLNYLVFIHNSFLNETATNSQISTKFPYMIGFKAHLKELDELLVSFTDCWKTTLNFRTTSPIEVDPILANPNWEMLSLLFKQTEAATEAKRNSIDLFLSWWFQPYIGGYHSLDFFGQNTMKHIYSKLKDVLDRQHTHYDLRCRLEIIYDELELFPELCLPKSPDYVIVSKKQLPDFRFEEDENEHQPERIDALVGRLVSASRFDSK